MNKQEFSKLVEKAVENLPEDFKKRLENVDIVVEALDSAETKVAFIEEILLKLPDKPIVAASGVSGIGKSERISIHKSGNFFLVEDQEAPSSDDGILLAPRVGLFAYWQANTVLEILTEGLDVY